MAGTIFSGWHGRRSGKPYFDELPRLAAGDCKHLDPGLLAVTADGKDYAVRLVRIPSGCMTRPAFICASCGKHCRVVYLRGIACCYRCTGAIYRSHSESPMRRAVRRATTIWRKCETDYKRPYGKPRWQRWPTFEKLSAEAEAAWPIIERDDCAIPVALARFEASLEAKRNAGKAKRGRPPKA
jgi:hypothetical protein